MPVQPREPLSGVKPDNPPDNPLAEVNVTPQADPSKPGETPATPEGAQAAAAPDAPEASDDAPVKRVRLVPADWTVDAVTFPYGDGEDRADITVTAAGPGNVPYTVDEADAAAVIAAAAEHGFGLVKQESNR